MSASAIRRHRVARWTLLGAWGVLVTVALWAVVRTEPVWEAAMTEAERAQDEALAALRSAVEACPEARPPARCAALRETLDRLEHPEAPLRVRAETARRQAEAGAWIVVLLGLLGGAALSAAARRQRACLVEPLEELASAARAIAEGDPMRRPHLPPCAVEEARQVATALDRLAERRPPPGNG